MTWNEACPAEGLDAVAVHWLAVVADGARAAPTSPVPTSPVPTSPVPTSPVKGFPASTWRARTEPAWLG